MGSTTDHSGVFTPRSQAYLRSVEAGVATLSSASIAERVRALVSEHDHCRANSCLNMNPAEGLMSPQVRALLASDMGSRLAEGLPGDKIFPHFGQTRFIDEIEATIIALVRRRFGARYVEWRPISNSMANAAVFFSLLTSTDTVFVQDIDGGGNLSYQSNGPLGFSGARIVPMATHGRTFEIDLEWVRDRSKELRPSMIVIGGSKVLFPYPVRELRDIADEIGAVLVYDAAHLGLLIGYGTFQRPLELGAHVVTLSTHKIMGGPVGGLVLTDDAEIAGSIISRTYPALLQTRDQNKYAALAFALAELEEFGPLLASATVANATALATALSEAGFSVLERNGVYTRTHQVFLELDDAAQEFERRCHAANILIPDCALTGDLARSRRSGARLATHELTRLGMGMEEMREVARLIAAAARESRDHAGIALEVSKLLARFPTGRYTFNERR